ncbi:hypothetical protein HYU94_03630 [Candidatus Daviesbacteria bacterium]|nr:hypothetical protein [Candidatus Daviesbacteria bacterium]
MRKKNDKQSLRSNDLKLTKAFEKLMLDMGVTFIDVTPKKRKPAKK